MKKLFKLYTLPVLTFVAGLGVYYLVFIALHPTKPSDQPVMANVEPTQVLDKSQPASSAQASSQKQSISSAATSQQEGISSALSASSLPSSVSATPVAENEKKPAITPEETAQQESDSQSIVTATSTSSVPSEMATASSSQPSASTAEPTPPAPEVCYAVTVPVLNIRQEPTINAEVVGKYQQDDIFCKIDERNGWILGEIGWVYARNFTHMVNTTPTPSHQSFANYSQASQVSRVAQHSSSVSAPSPVNDQLYPPTPPPMKQRIPKPKPDFTIQSTAITEEQRIAILKDKFQQSQDPRYAIEISNYYYDIKDYQTSNNWAVTANDIDKTMEDSWILFAKSAFMMGKKNEAIQSIETYLKNYDSTKAQTLLQEMRRHLNTMEQP